MESEKIDRLRNISLDAVLEAVGAVRDPKDRNNWRTSAGRLTLTGQKFFNHDAKRGGGGAFDLVMHLQDCGFKEAVGFLESLPETSQSVAKDEKEIKSVVPAPAQENWPHVRDYLTRIRKISGALVDSLCECGIIYADKYKNAVFLSENRKGAELRGTGAVPFHGFRGEKCPFRISGTWSDVAFVESAIDALSLRDLDFPGDILSFSGGAKGLIQSYARDAKKKGLKIWGAFDNDKAGDTFFEVLKEAVQDAGRVYPINGKDWNAELIWRSGGGG